MLVRKVMRYSFFAILVISSLLILIPINSYEEHIFKDQEAFAQYLDIAQIMGEKVTFEIGDETFELYYGYKGSLDSMGSEDITPTLSSMNINEERKSIEIVMEDVPEKTDFWVRIPFEVLSAENEEFTVLVDGEDTRYDLMRFPNDYVVGFVISETTENIEIIGTQVIPEFGSLVILVFGVSIFGLVYFMRKFSQGRILTINKF